MKDKDPYQNSGCWHAFIFYFNREDPRIIVPKRFFRRLGWTLNFARPMAVPTLLIIIALILVPFKILSFYGIDSTAAHFATVLIEIAVLCAVSSWMSNPARFDDQQEQDRTGS